MPSLCYNYLAYPFIVIVHGRTHTCVMVGMRRSEGSFMESALFLSLYVAFRYQTQVINHALRELHPWSHLAGAILPVALHSTLQAAGWPSFYAFLVVSLAFNG